MTIFKIKILKFLKKISTPVMLSFLFAALITGALYYFLFLVLDDGSPTLKVVMLFGAFVISAFFSLVIIPENVSFFAKDFLKMNATNEPEYLSTLWHHLLLNLSAAPDKNYIHIYKNLFLDSFVDIETAYRLSEAKYPSIANNIIKQYISMGFLGDYFNNITRLSSLNASQSQHFIPTEAHIRAFEFYFAANNHKLSIMDKMILYKKNREIPHGLMEKIISYEDNLDGTFLRYLVANATQPSLEKLRPIFMSVHTREEIDASFVSFATNKTKDVYKI